MTKTRKRKTVNYSFFVTFQKKKSRVFMTKRRNLTKTHKPGNLKKIRISKKLNFFMLKIIMYEHFYTFCKWYIITFSFISALRFIFHVLVKFMAIGLNWQYHHIMKHNLLLKCNHFCHLITNISLSTIVLNDFIKLNSE